MGVYFQVSAVRKDPQDQVLGGPGPSVLGHQVALRTVLLGSPPHLLLPVR